MKAKNERKLELLVEADGYVGKDDTVQTSEELYKASDEAVKELASRFDLSEYEEAKKNGRWTTLLLFRAVRKLSEKW
jgi:hypothetical protein